MASDNMAPNEKAIRKWINDNRPDLAPHIDGLVRNNATIGIMAIAFEAGRDFQRANPAAQAKFLAFDIEYNFDY